MHPGDGSVLIRTASGFNFYELMYSYRVQVQWECKRRLASAPNRIFTYLCGISRTESCYVKSAQDAEFQSNFPFCLAFDLNGEGLCYDLMSVRWSNNLCIVNDLKCDGSGLWIRMICWSMAVSTGCQIVQKDLYSSLSFSLSSIPSAIGACYDLRSVDIAFDS